MHNKEEKNTFWTDLILTVSFLIGALCVKIIIDGSIVNPGILFYLVYTFFWMLLFAFLVIAVYFSWQLIKEIIKMGGFDQRQKHPAGSIKESLHEFYEHGNQAKKVTKEYLSDLTDESSAREEKIVDEEKIVIVKGNQRKYRTKNH